MKIIRRVALLIFGAAFLLYGGDFLLAEIQGNKGLGSVDVRIMWAIRQKNGRIDYELGDTETRPCVHTLFPHSGYAACWYLTRHKNQVIKVGSVIPPRSRHRQAAWYPVNSCRFPIRLPEPIFYSSSFSRCGRSAI